MNKFNILAIALIFTLVACGNKNSFELTTKEKELANNDPNIAAQILIRKAILKESKQEKYDEQDKFNLELAKEEAEVNYYLNKKIGNNFNLQVTDKEVEDYYEKNKAEFGIYPLPTIEKELRDMLLVEKQNQALDKYYQELIDKYKLNDILKKEYPELN